MKTRNQSARKAYEIYFYAVVGIGFSVLGISAFQVLAGEFSYEWLIFAALTAITGRLTVRLPGGKSKICFADAFIFANLTLFGPAVGSLTAALEGFLGSIRFNATPRQLKYTLFNVAVMAGSSYLAGMILLWITGAPPLYGSRVILMHEIMLPIMAMAVVHYLSNTAIVALIVGLEGSRNPLSVWWNRFRWASLNYLAGASAAGLIVTNVATLTPSTFGLVLPILLLTYFAYKTYLDRSEENAHRLQLDRLYLRTVEALSIAIDARESGTLGHARQVQVCAQRLAKAMNLADEKEFRGIQSAALLLDIGNLAVPEYILNNPGELSETEFRKVMIHPVVGCNILSTIDFPYPVAPYVRHHHEHWDGSGYPDKLEGEAIPLGARILSVADCFVALTCDRPYQKAHSIKRAREIISSKAGSHYDPAVVAVFDTVAEQIGMELNALVKGMRIEDLRGTSLSSPKNNDDHHAFRDISSTQKEVSVLYELSHSLGSTLNEEQALSIVAGQVSRIIPFDTCVIYLYSEKRDCLIARHASGLNAEALKDYSITTDNSLSGWVAENKEAALNARSKRDLEPIQGQLSGKTEYALVYPLVSEGECLGTITLYGRNGSRFGEDDLRVLSIVAQKTAPTLQNSLRFAEAHQGAVTDALTLLHNVRYLRSVFPQELEKARQHGYAISVLGMDLDGFKTINDRFGHQVGDRIIVAVATLLKSMLREKDHVVRHGGDEFIAALIQTDHEDALLLANRIQRSIDNFRLEITPGQFAQIGISIGCASYPEDGETLEALLKKADVRMYANKQERHGRRTHMTVLDGTKG